MTSLDTLMRLHDDRTASTAVILRLTRSAASDLARTALARLQARVDPADSDEAHQLTAILRLLGEHVPLPSGEPDRTLRILEWFRTADRPAALSARSDESDALLAGADESFAEMDWERTRELVSRALLGPGLDSNRALRAVRLLVCVHHNRGEFEPELAILERTSLLLPNVAPLEEADLLMLRGNALSELRQFEKARACYVVARRMATRIEPTPWMQVSNALVNSANAFLECSRLRLRPAHLRRARRDYRRAYKLLSRYAVESSNSGGLRADRLVNIATTYARQAKLMADASLQVGLLARSARIARFALYCNRNLPSHESRRREAHILSVLADVYERMGRNGQQHYFLEAKQVHEQAVALSDDTGSGPDVAWNARLAFAGFCLRGQKWLRARRLLLEAHVQSERERRRRETLEGRVGLARENRRIYRGLVDVELARSGGQNARIASTFRWIETAKARTQLDAFAGMVTAERYRASVSAPIALSNLRRQLPARSCLIEYFEGTGGFVALAITPEAARVIEIGTPIDELRARLQVLRHLLAECESACDCIAELQLLGHQLMEPVLAQFPELPRLLIIIPDGALHGLPFHALRFKDRYLVEHVPILHSPSASVFVRAARRAARLGTEPFLGIGVSDLDEWRPNTPRLPAAEAEITHFANAWNQHGWHRELVGSAATCHEVLNEIPHAGTIHFACHAETNDRVPADSFLGLTDGPLTVGALRRGPRLRAAQVVLNACSSGKDNVDRGDEHVGFVTAFLQAGAGSVLGTLWDVDDGEAARFVDSYYRELQAGQSSVDALRRAQLKWISAAAKQPAPPWLWSAYFLAGASIVHRVV